LREWVGRLQHPLAEDLRHALTERLSALEEIGLNYLTLDRPVGTLSGGEAQRCKIAKYINSPLSDVLYILDEPSVGLHEHDIRLMQQSVRKLKEKGNTVLLVEHHQAMIRIADHIVDMGPGAGAEGGEILFEGSYESLLQSRTTTGQMLREHVPVKTEVRTPQAFFQLSDARLHNLKNVSVRLPLGVICGIAGVAGSGKSSLMQCFREAYSQPSDIVYISQKNIGISLRSTPATYLDAADEIRKLFARHNKVKADLFSFNGKGGCPVCKGKGVIVSDMAFMDSIETPCEACGGLRYSEEALRHTLHGQNIAQVMDMPATKACAFFAGTPVAEKLQALNQVGLGYLHLNQSLSTLSGGELQRLKLASHLLDNGKILILDEPTDGLHLNDIRKLMRLFGKMTDAGNSLFLIEHNTHVLRQCDYLVELGPGGGEAGGNILFTGTPQEMRHCAASVTREYLEA
ncbi:MAG: ATP-binding cassette domain-containing protein, partial [Bacteroidales bacterium]|nr:ATP-binding cassette domain-containing protein [Bacteroidales bacterium]